MAFRNFLFRALNNCTRTVACPYVPGDPLILSASSNVFSVCEKSLIQFRKFSGTRSLHTGACNISESSSNKDNTITKETSGTLPDILQKLDSDSTTDSHVDVSNPSDKGKSVESSVVSDMKVSKRHDLAMLYTCKVCETRSVKTMSRESYENGIVIVRCSGCNNLHLIADRLGWFGEPSSVEDFLRARGEEIQRGSQDSYELTLEDLAGGKPK
ncbi:hypothetical protein SUGI_0453810 [Cryptomeria japonica]|uniref:uncharacterized protein LOC131033670 n=1 Tax=Cryptomeria japonica TaxID=3369 RepID=UPI002408A966|nr:uncharacterized protein LOC131033670 [Cryptomeria japonica]GLJ23883.1 hypothetical protein SUGI_0453810 [Cryptomeria japonica]